jgi:methyl-accepting chemotaxis protein
MNLLFAPATRLMSRLTFRGKFLVVGAVLTVVLAFFLVDSIRRVNDDLAMRAREKTGVDGIAKLVVLNAALIDYRGALIHATPDPGEVSRRRQEAANALAEVDAFFKGPGAVLELPTMAADTRAVIEGIEQKVAVLPADANRAVATFKAFGPMFDHMYGAMTKVGDRGGLALDPDSDTFHVVYPLSSMIPRLAGITARVGAYAGMVIERGVVGPDDRVFFDVAFARTRDYLSETKVMLDTAFDANPGLRDRLGPQIRKADAAIEAQSAFVKARVLAGDKPVATAAELQPTAAAARESTFGFFRDAVATMQDTIDARVRAASVSRAVSGLLGVGAIALSGWLFFGMYLSVKHTTDNLTSAAGRLAQGDLTVRVEIDTRDELATVSRQFNAMATAFADLVRGIQTAARQVSDGAAQVARGATQMTTASEAQSAAASSTATAVDAVTASIARVAENAGETVSVSTQAAERSASGERLVSTAAAETRAIADAVSTAAAEVTTLGARSEEISRIVNVIKEIADQTNLLALNAAIEAARAGEQGRGFAVVADEVRGLAERTAKATAEIGDMIGKIQVGTRASVASMNAGSERVRSGVEMSESAAAALKDIEAGARTALEKVSEIAAATQAQRQSATEIARNVESIARMAGENAVAIQQMNASARSMETQAAALTQLVQRFRVT